MKWRFKQSYSCFANYDAGITLQHEGTYVPERLDLADASSLVKSSMLLMKPETMALLPVLLNLPQSKISLSSQLKIKNVKKV